MAKNDLILGTAGHIDHGKSSLIKALTGTDPDRLVEEKERGITITLGFAQLTLPSGRKLGVVDVPGHERFVRQMVAGATGVDLALLVIAADDGIMPQTVEHLSVLELLGIKSCVVALTKIDLVDDEWLSFIEDEIRGALEGTPYAGAPIVPCSSVTGDGLDKLKQAIDDAAAHAERSKPTGSLRYPIDRVFTVKGFGTVVTGTLWSGTVHVNDEVELLPQGITTRVRSIQMHGIDKDAAAPGNRVALCLANVSTDEVHPGDFIAAPKTITTSDRFDAELTYSDPLKQGKPLMSGARVHIAHGTKEVMGRILCMDGIEKIEPGETKTVQIRLDSDALPLSYQDRFIVRSYSPVHVIAGGVVLAPHPRRRTTLQGNERKMLEALSQGKEKEACDAFLFGLEKPMMLKEIEGLLGLQPKFTGNRIEQLVKEKVVAYIGEKGAYIAPIPLRDSILSSIENALLKFHAQNPTSTGLAKEELMHKVDLNMSKACFSAVIEDAQAKGLVVQHNGELSHPRASAGAKAQLLEAQDKVADAFIEADEAPKSINEMLNSTNLNPGIARKALQELLASGRVIRVTNDLAFSAEVIERYKKAIEETIRKNGPSKAADLKDACNTSRKYMMPILEYLDAQGFTKRDGDLRTLI